MNISFVEDLLKKPGYTKIMKDLVSNRRTMYFEIVEISHSCSVIISRNIVVKKENLVVLTIPCTIGVYKFGKSLYDLVEIINLTPLSIFNKLGLGAPKTTTMKLLIVIRSIKRPVRILYDVLVLVDKFLFPTDFIILDSEIDYKALINTCNPFLSIRKELINTKYGEIKFWVYQQGEI